MKKIFKSKEALLYIFSICMILSYTAWNSLLNNFVVEVASFDGSQIGILQSLREVPGFLAFSVVLVLFLIKQQHLAYLSIIVLGFGTLLTGYFPSVIGLYITTVIISIGFHYLETLNQSLSLQWLNKEKAPLILGRITAVKSFTGLAVIAMIFILMKYFNFPYENIYLIFGGLTILIGVLCWIFFEHFKDDIVQEKKLKIKKEYWLFYLLTFLAGARRQIFIVFAGFLLVEKFGVDVETMLILLFVNLVFNILVAPKIGQYIIKLGERKILQIEYFGLLIVFTSYAFVESLYFAFFLYVIDNILFIMSLALKTYFQKIADPKDISTASAVSFTINHIGAIFLPFLLGIVWLYSYSLVFIIGATIALCSFMLSSFVPINPQQGCETRIKEKILNKIV